MLDAGQWFDFPVDGSGNSGVTQLVEVASVPKVEPEVRRRSKEAAQPKRSITRGRPLAVDDLVHARKRNPQPARSAGSAGHAGGSTR